MTSRTTSKRPTNDQQATTNNNVENLKNEKKITYSPESFEYQISSRLLSLIQKRSTNLKQPDLQQWAAHVDKMLRIDGRQPEDIERVVTWCQADSFWQNNILSTEKLRRQFDQLFLRMQQRVGAQCGGRLGGYEENASKGKYADQVDEVIYTNMDE